MEFQKLYPKKDSEKWVHGSAVWALKEHPRVQVYKGRTHPAQGREWIVIVESADGPIPEWVEKAAETGRRHWSDPHTIRLFPESKFHSFREAKEALGMAEAGQYTGNSELIGYL